MDFNFRRLNNIEDIERDTEILTPSLRKEILWAAKEYRRLANHVEGVLAGTEPPIDADGRRGHIDELAGEDWAIFTYDVYGWDPEEIPALLRRIAETCVKRANESGSERGYRRAKEISKFVAAPWNMGVDEVVEEVA